MCDKIQNSGEYYKFIVFTNVKYIFNLKNIFQQKKFIGILLNCLYIMFFNLKLIYVLQQYLRSLIYIFWSIKHGLHQNSSGNIEIPLKILLNSFTLKLKLLKSSCKIDTVILNFFSKWITDRVAFMIMFMNYWKLIKLRDFRFT